MPRNDVLERERISNDLGTSSGKFGGFGAKRQQFENFLSEFLGVAQRRQEAVPLIAHHLAATCKISRYNGSRAKRRLHQRARYAFGIFAWKREDVGKSQDRRNVGARSCCRDIRGSLLKFAVADTKRTLALARPNDKETHSRPNLLDNVCGPQKCRDPFLFGHARDGSNNFCVSQAESVSQFGCSRTGPPRLFEAFDIDPRPGDEYRFAIAKQAVSCEKRLISTVLKYCRVSKKRSDPLQGQVSGPQRQRCW